jgi:hypothetical protein
LWGNFSVFYPLFFLYAPRLSFSHFHPEDIGKDAIPETIVKSVVNSIGEPFKSPIMNGPANSILFSQQ